ncbi:MAG: aminotransferase class I and II [Chlorobi bacterium]|nr:MAG: hypothetical protein UZ07_CHB004003250 [Chlorobi bacterium OLB7]MBK8911839.1 aminotransferase class I and II [Chlorobiota bacterium]MBX7215519.1 aminotransferase class I and II [Candidatus Kapabacteria bacterium]
MNPSLPTYQATRYVTPLREGGSLPAILDTEDGGMFVAKFRGAGQGAKALIAEIIVGSFATALRLPTPSLALIQIGESFGRTEPDPEIQDILRGSIGINVGARYLEGAYNFDPVTIIDVVPNVAANIVWLDAFATNIDRTPRNPNMMFWKNGLWLIDHGAALYFHHHWGGVTDATSQSPFAPIRDHVLLPFAGSIAEADERLRPLLPPERIAEILNSVPDDLLMDAPAGVAPSFPTPEENRQAYQQYFQQRLGGQREFVSAAEEARKTRQRHPLPPKEYRR